MFCGERPADPVARVSQFVRRLLIDLERFSFCWSNYDNENIRWKTSKRRSPRHELKN